MSLSTVSFRFFVLTVGMASLGCTSLRTRTMDSRVAPVPPPAKNPVGQELNVVYARAGGEDLQLDVYFPKDAPGPFPAVVLLHGGGWAKGSHEDLRPFASTCAAHGYVAVTVGYRLAPRHPFPAQIQDTKCAVRWLRANAARYRIDGEHMGAVGFSAGAQLALLLGLTESSDGFEGEGGNRDQSSRVQVVVNISGPTDLTRPGWSQPIEGVIADLVGSTRQQAPDAYRTASPITYVRRGAPPVLTLHGTEDAVVPYEQAQLLHTALRKVKVPSRLTPLHGMGHGDDWSAQTTRRNTTAILAFLDENLRRQ